MRTRALGVVLLLLTACDARMSGGKLDLTPVARNVGKAPEFTPAPLPFDVAAEVGLPARCIRHILAANLLSRQGSPAVMAAINGREGAAFLSPSEDEIGVFGDEELDLDLPDLRVESVRTINGVHDTFQTRLDRLTFAQGHAERVPAAKLGDYARHVGKGVRPLAIFGFDMLGNYDVLLDIPARRVVLFKRDEAPDCPSLSTVIGKRPYQALLHNGTSGASNLVEVHLGNTPVGMYVEPNSNLSVMSEDDALATGLTKAEVESGDRVNTLTGSNLLGWRHDFPSAAIGNWHGGPFGANVEPVAYNLLGLDFFRHRRVLMAFPEGMVFFGDAIPDTTPDDGTTGLFSPISSHIARTRVTQDVGPSSVVLKPGL